MHKKFTRYLVAASILLVLGLGSYFVFFAKKKWELPPVAAQGPADVKAPQTARATITLGDGRQVYLDEVSNGPVTQVGNIKLVKVQDGQIAYQAANGEILKSMQYNTLSNPRGSRVIDMTLSDGSHVWLNAGSSIKYPVAFVGVERKVEITGEAYFEVAHDVAKPFYVLKGETEVKVLGTHFNVNAYDDEDAIRVTLLEGSVIVDRASSLLKLKPGEQAVVQRNSLPTLYPSPNLDEVMAWKNGRFLFNGSDIKTIMRQLEKWYDVQVEYQTAVPYSFVGTIARDVPLSEVLHLLSLTEGVRFRIAGNKIIVLK